MVGEKGGFRGSGDEKRGWEEAGRVRRQGREGTPGST
jgi:hypothetical protein